MTLKELKAVISVMETMSKEFVRGRDPVMDYYEQKSRLANYLYHMVANKDLDAVLDADSRKFLLKQLEQARYVGD